MTFGSIAGSLAALAFVLVLLGVTLHILRRFTGAGRGVGGQLPLTILQRVAITPRQALAVVRVRDRVIVVSTGDGGIRLLLELGEEDAREMLAAPDQSAATAWNALEVVGAAKTRGVAFVEHLQEAVRRRAAMLLLLAACCGLALPQPASAQETTVAPTPEAQPTAAQPQLQPQVAPPAQPQIAPQAQPQFAPQLPATTPLFEGPPQPPEAARLPSLPPRPVPGPQVVQGGGAGRASTTPQPTAAGPQLDLKLGDARDGGLQLSGPVGTVVALGLLTMLPTLVLLMTSFTRIIIVLHLLRQALGTQSAPPAHLMGALALILTGFVMSPTLTEVNRTAIEPWMQGRIEQAEMLKAAQGPFRDFMLRQTREHDLATFVDLSATEATSVEDVPITVLVSAFATSELRTAFQIGFVLFLPFIIIDIVVAAVLMSMGMFMLPPAMISLPFKLLLFVLVDGWTLIVQSLVTSFR